MKAKVTLVLLTAILLFRGYTMALADSKIQMKVFTSSPEGFSVNSTLIYGEKDAILIDAQFTQSDAHRLVAMLIESKRNLSAVYVTHPHPDHYFGFTVIKQAFPNAKFLALPSIATDAKNTAEAKVKVWKPVYGDNVTSSPMIPEPLEDKVGTLEGETVQVFGEVQGDDKHSSYLWFPSLKAVIAGDIVYHGIYPWTAETTPAERKEWIKTLDKIASLKPSIVVAGHKKAELKDDPSSVQFTKEYLVYFDEALASSKNAEELMSKIRKKYPDLGLDIILKIGADAAFSKKN
jgi:glyoxylase-like metal-dependent hydrolase (beta-lactamase superfamily II)